MLRLVQFSTPPTRRGYEAARSELRKRWHLSSDTQQLMIWQRKQGLL